MIEAALKFIKRWRTPHGAAMQMARTRELLDELRQIPPTTNPLECSAAPAAPIIIYFNFRAAYRDAGKLYYTRGEGFSRQT